MLIKIVSIMWIIGIGVKIPAIRRIIDKFPIISKIAGLLPRILRSLMLDDSAVYNNHSVVGTGAAQCNIPSITPYSYNSEIHSTSISNYSNCMQPGNMYYNNN